jgi:hypothetical protein
MQTAEKKRRIRMVIILIVFLSSFGMSVENLERQKPILLVDQKGASEKKNARRMQKEQQMAEMMIFFQLDIRWYVGYMYLLLPGLLWLFHALLLLISSLPFVHSAELFFMSFDAHVQIR